MLPVQVSDEFSQHMYTIAQHLKRGEPESALSLYQGLAGSSSMDEVRQQRTYDTMQHDLGPASAGSACVTCNCSPHIWCFPRRLALL